MSIIGKTGTGKSTLLETMAIQDVRRRKGLILIDPHCDLVDRIAAQIPAHRQAEVIYLNAADPTQPYGYNPLRHVRHAAAIGKYYALHPNTPLQYVTAYREAFTRMQADADFREKAKVVLDPTMR